MKYIKEYNNYEDGFSSRENVRKFAKKNYGQIPFTKDELEEINNLSIYDGYGELENPKTYGNSARLKKSGVNFWCGSVDLIDGQIKEVHPFIEALLSGFHHSYYFSSEELNKMEDGESAFFWIDDAVIKGEWREKISNEIIPKIEKQITFLQDKKIKKTITDKPVSKVKKWKEWQKPFENKKD